MPDRYPERDIEEGDAYTGGTPFFQGTPEEKVALQYELDNATPEDLEEGRRLLAERRALEAQYTSDTGFPMLRPLQFSSGRPVRRGFGTTSSYNPDTGETRTATIQEPRSALPQFPIPRPRRDPMEEMRKTINAIQFQKANDAYKAALSFQAARAYRQDLDAGKSQAEALARWGHMLPGGLAGAAAMTRESRPAFTPQRLPGSEDLYQVGPRGERLFQYRPQKPPVGTGPIAPPELYTDPSSGIQFRRVGNGWAPLPGQSLTKKATPVDQAQIKAATTQWNTAAELLAVEQAKAQPDQKKIASYNQTITGASNTLSGISKELPKSAQGATPAEPSVNEVVRLTKDGKKAVFDADTRKFIRYAD